MENNRYIFQIAKLNDVHEIYNLMLTVYNKLDNKDVFVCDDLDFVREHIADRGFIVVVRDSHCDNKLIAYLMVRYPKIDDDNLGRDIGLNFEELQKVVHMESAVVLPEYRGMGLQYQLLIYAESKISKNEHKYLMGTVSPDNPASYKTVEKAGYKNILTKEKYNGLVRRIYCKTL